MDRVFTITSMDGEDKVKIRVHHEDSIRLIKLLADVGFISDYCYGEDIYDTNDYSETVTE